MNKGAILASFFVSLIFVNAGISAKGQNDRLHKQCLEMDAQNLYMQQEIKVKKAMIKSRPVLLSMEYGFFINQVKMLEAYSGAEMSVQLDGSRDSDDISTHYTNTEYKGIRGLKIQIVIDKFSKDTDMAEILDDIHLLEQTTDFMVNTIDKDNNNLTVKGVVYGL